MTPDRIEDEGLALVSQIDTDVPDVDKLAIVRAAEAALVKRLAASVDAKRAELAAIESALAGAVTSQPDPPTRTLTEDERAGVRRTILAEMREHADSPSMPWTCGQVASAVALEGPIVSRELRVLVKDGSLVQRGRRYEPCLAATVEEAAQ